MKLALALLVLAISMQVAAAYDASALRVIGFSPDGRHFAFEENGDNEAGHYTTTVILDTATSKHAAGSPFAGIEDNETLDKANARAAAAIKRLHIGTKPSLTVTVPEAVAHETAVSSPIEKLQDAMVKTLALPEGFGSGARLTLTQSLKRSRKCQYDEAGATVFRLALEKTSAKPLLIGSAQNISSPDDCPTGYGIAEAHMLKLPGGSEVIGVIVQYFYAGFEGTDRRFMAVTARIPKS